jgi:hypothetical protein
VSSGSSRQLKRSRKQRKNQADQVYQSEWEVFPPQFSRSDFSSIAEIQGFVNYVQLSSIWRTLGGPLGTVVKDNGDHDHSCAAIDDNEIWISRTMRTRPVVLHELAHLASKGDDTHGHEFVISFLVLVSYFMGQHYHHLLEEAFKRNKVS